MNLSGVSLIFEFSLPNLIQSKFKVSRKGTQSKVCNQNFPNFDQIDSNLIDTSKVIIITLRKILISFFELYLLSIKWYNIISLYLTIYQLHSSLFIKVIIITLHKF